MKVISKGSWFLLLLASVAPAQEVGSEVAVALEARSPEGGKSLRWSPKGAKVPLHAKAAGLEGSFPLGPPGLPEVRVRLERRAGGERHEVLWIDLDRDGAFAAGERFETDANLRREKWWSSFSADFTIPLPGEGETPPAMRAYPVNLWFVEDPSEPEAEPALRWSRRGWHQGAVELGGRRALVLLTEMEMDGVFDERDSWALARTEEELLKSSSRSLSRHAWLNGVAYRARSIDPHGRSIALEAFDPGITEEEERAREDRYAEDRRAKSAESPLAFSHDLDAALALAAKEGKRIFLDFETTWCGPCKQMDQMVYTKQAVVDAAKDVICVKLDGDREKELVKRHGVAGYPTLILLDANGREVRRAVGYRGVKEMVTFFGE